jgi:NAD(P)-dependent dehydrogenase (short-subunit alcohol dehydrogenase family)
MAAGLPAVLVLGGRGDIGSAVARRFSDAGHQVLAVGRADFDLTEPRSIADWFGRPHPPVGILIHSAGLNHPKRFEDLTDEEIKECFSANVEGFLQVARWAIPDLVAQRGRVVVLSSIFGFLSRVGRLPYAMSKHALIGVVKTLALELADVGVLVNAVSPGYIDTRLTRANNDAATIARLSSAVPLRRLGAPEDVAEVVYFLGSADNRYITGQDVVVDGGFSIDGGRG